MLGALRQEFGLEFGDLRKVAAIDATQAFGCWLSASGRLAEAVVADLHGSHQADGVLWKGIDGLCAQGYAPWLLSYLHVLRVQGNETVHFHEKDLG